MLDFLVLDFLDQLDRALFLWLNAMHAPWADSFMAFITNQRTWYPVYVVMFAAILYKQRWKGLLTIAFFLVAVGLSNFLTSEIFKPIVERLRPCHNPEISDLLHLVGGCGGQFGFMSSHAANHFSIATFLWLVFRKETRYMWPLFIWAALIAYSRVYVGVHYPGDIICGGLTGALMAWLCHKGYLTAS